MLIAALVASGIGAIAGYFYFRPPTITPLSKRGLHAAVRIGLRQSREDL